MQIEEKNEMAEQMMQASASSYTGIEKVIADNSALFQKPGVLAVEPGNLFVNGWITSTPAIVVRVMRKIPLSELAPEDRLPRRVGGYRVDVIPSSPTEQLAMLKASMAAAPQPLAAAPHPYVPIPGNPIDRVFEISKPILCHASPDAGWPTLQRFLSGVQDRLTIAMYDFNAEYIARELIKDVETSNAKVELVLDPQENAQELDIQTRLKNRLPNNYKLGLASVGSNQNFNTAYHEKVVVRDSSAFWLSSGNFSVSSQPDIDPFGPNPPSSNIYGLGNRDWHIIVQDTMLAQVFEQYIEHDMNATGAGPTPPVAFFPDLLLPQEVFAETLAVAAAAPPAPVAPRALPTPDQLPVRVQPLLTPDNYIGHIHDLVLKAEKSLYLQLQYIHASDREGDERFTELLKLVGQRTKQANFDARIIIGQGDAHLWITELKKPKWGFDPSKIKVQQRVHNKGIIVDGETVVVGSHNWSGDGTLRNRDASLIIYNSQIASYYQNIFLNDWAALARPDVQENFTPLVVMPGQPTPAGMVRIPWSDFYDE